jgi:hypothetical protein
MRTFDLTGADRQIVGQGVKIVQVVPPTTQIAMASAHRRLIVVYFGSFDVAGERRQRLIETPGFDVREFLGVISYWTSGRPKIVHFWRMQAADTPGRTLTSDVKAMKWLGLASAIERLSTPHEQAFLQHVRRHAVELMEPERRKARSTKSIA